MRDHETEELISAYLDGELDENERNQVEEVLRDSAEHQRLLDDLKSLRASFEELPRYSLGGEFHERVLARIQEEETQSAGVVATDSSPAGGRILIAAVALAAAVLLAVGFFMRPGNLNPELAQDPVHTDPEAPEVDVPLANSPAENEPPAIDPSEYFVYFKEDEGRRTYTLVGDLTISKAGQDNEAFKNLLARAGIELEDDLSVTDPQLQRSIMNSRMVAGPGGGGNLQEGIELIYVVCEGDKIDGILADANGRKDEFPLIRLDVIINPDELDTIYRLNQRSQHLFAGRVQKEQRALAHRVVFRVGGSSPLLGAIAVPRLKLDFAAIERSGWTSLLPQLVLDSGEVLMDSRQVSDQHRLTMAPQDDVPVDRGQEAPEGAVELSPQARSLNPGLDDAPSQILFILRNLP